jgi:uncharacterized protein (DUF4415 family)
MKKRNELVPPAPDVEADFSRGVRGKYARRDPATAKSRITIYLDDDVLEHFKAQARVPGAAPYQTLINATLRAAVTRASGQQSPVLVDPRALLADEHFIAALADVVRRRTQEAGSDIL